MERTLEYVLEPVLGSPCVSWKVMLLEPRKDMLLGPLLVALMVNTMAILSVLPSEQRLGTPTVLQ